MVHMIDDVLSVVSRTDGVTGIVVISDDDEVKHQALNYNARILPEPKQLKIPNKTSPMISQGVEQLNRVFLVAMTQLADEGETSVLLLPADVPLITVDNLQQMFAQHTDPGVTIVPASADSGTNAMMVSPPQFIAPGYGHRSSRRHGDFCRAAGMNPTVLCIPELGLDVDTVEDLCALMAAPVSSSTQRFLLGSDIMRRIERLDQNNLKISGRQTA